MLIDKLSGHDLNVAVVSALGLEFDAVSEEVSNKITIIDRIDHGEGMPDEVSTRYAPKYHEDVNAASKLLESFIVDHRFSTIPGIHYGYYYQIVMSQYPDYSVMLCFMSKSQRVTRFAMDARSTDRLLATAMCRTWLKSLEMMGELDYITVASKVNGINSAEIDAERIIDEAKAALAAFDLENKKETDR